MHDFSELSNMLNNFLRAHGALKLNRVIFIMRLQRDLYYRELSGDYVTFEIIVEGSVVVPLPGDKPAILSTVEAQVCSATDLLHESESNLVHGRNMLLVHIVFNSVLLGH